MNTHSPPIQNLDSLDVVGERKDGGVDLLISCSGPLDDSPATLRLLAQKVANYLTGAAHANFSNVYPAAKRGPVRIFISCDYVVSEGARREIASLAQRAATMGVELKLGSPVA